MTIEKTVALLRMVEDEDPIVGLFLDGLFDLKAEGLLLLSPSGWFVSNAGRSLLTGATG